MQGQATIHQDQDTPHGIPPATGEDASLSPINPVYLIALRNILRLSQNEMGTKVGYSSVQLGRFERGEWPITSELISNLLPLLSLAQQRIDKDQLLLDALKEQYNALRNEE